MDFGIRPRVDARSATSQLGGPLPGHIHSPSLQFLHLQNGAKSLVMTTFGWHDGQAEMTTPNPF